MALGIFARATTRALRRLGEGALLRGVDAGLVNVERGVDLSPGNPDRSDDNHVVRYTVVSIEAQYDPRVGDEVVHPDGTFLLDRLVTDNGSLRRFVATQLA